MKVWLWIVLLLFLLVASLARADSVDNFTWQTPLGVITFSESPALSAYPYAASQMSFSFSPSSMCNGQQLVLGFDPIGFDINAPTVQPPGVNLEGVCYQPDPLAPPPGLDSFNYFDISVVSASMFASDGNTFSFVPGTYDNGVLTIVDPPASVSEGSTALFEIIGMAAIMLLCLRFREVRINLKRRSQ